MHYLKHIFEGKTIFDMLVACLVMASPAIIAAVGALYAPKTMLFIMLGVIFGSIAISVFSYLMRPRK